MLETNPKKSILDPLYDENTYLCVETERMVSAGLGADCSLPVAALADLRNGVLSLKKVQLAGKKEVSIKDFNNAYQLIELS